MGLIHACLTQHSSSASWHSTCGICLSTDLYFVVNVYDIMQISGCLLILSIQSISSSSYYKSVTSSHYGRVTFSMAFILVLILILCSWIATIWKVGSGFVSERHYLKDISLRDAIVVYQ